MLSSPPDKLISSDYKEISIDETVFQLLQLLDTPYIDYIVIFEKTNPLLLTLMRFLGRKIKVYRYCLKNTDELIQKLKASSPTDPIHYFLQQNNVEPASLITYDDKIADIKDGGLLINSDKQVAGVINQLPANIPGNYIKLSDLLTPAMRDVFEQPMDYSLVNQDVHAYRGVSYGSTLHLPKPGKDNGAVAPYNIQNANETAHWRPRIGFPTAAEDAEKPVDAKEPAWYLNVEAAPKAKTDKIYTLLVSIDDTAIATYSASLADDVKKGASIQVVISAKAGFEVTSDEYRELEVGKDVHVLFTLKPLHVGEGKILVYAFLNGVQVASVDVRVDIMAPEAAVESELPKPVAVAFSPLSRHAPADLSLFIKEEKAANGDILLTFTIIHLTPAANVYLREYKADPIKSDPQRYIQSMFKSIEELKLDSKENRENAVNNLKSKGSALFAQLIPSELGALLWKLKDQVTTVIINSEEPWIPWELCRFTYEEEGVIKPGPFFCEMYQITRWIAGKQNPKDIIDLSRAAFVIPRDSNLLYTAKEKEKIQQMLSAHNYAVEDVLASTHELTKKLQEGVYSVFHFSGHGFFADPTDADQAYLILEDQDKFSPENINGETKNLGLAKPLVFFNACQIGRSAMSLTGIGGWAKQFLDAGAAVFIGTYWNVADEKACRFAITLYEQLLAGATIGLAAYTARKAINDSDGDPTWLAYTIYASPNATIST